LNAREEEAEAGGREREGGHAEEKEDVARQVIVAASGRIDKPALRVR
jgi:hypothetical protein